MTNSNLIFSQDRLIAKIIHCHEKHSFINAYVMKDYKLDKNIIDLHIYGRSMFTEEDFEEFILKIAENIGFEDWTFRISRSILELYSKKTVYYQVEKNKISWFNFYNKYKIKKIEEKNTFVTVSIYDIFFIQKDYDNNIGIFFRENMSVYIYDNRYSIGTCTYDEKNKNIVCLIKNNENINCEKQYKAKLNFDYRYLPGEFLVESITLMEK